MSNQYGTLLIKDDHRKLSPSERLPWHCSRVLREHWMAFGCPDEAVKVYTLPDGSRVGFCFRHLEDGKKHAEFRGWVEVAA